MKDIQIFVTAALTPTLTKQRQVNDLITIKQTLITLQLLADAIQLNSLPVAVDL